MRLALLAALAGECLDNRYTRLSWAVLNWNSDAIALYDGLGAEPQSEWTTYRLSGPPLAEDLPAAALSGAGISGNELQSVRSTWPLDGSVNSSEVGGSPLKATRQASPLLVVTGA